MEYKFTKVYEIKNQRVIINYTEFIKLINRLGVYRYCPDSKDYILVQIENNIIKRVSIPDIKEMVIDFLKNDLSSEIVIEKILRSVNSLFSKGLLDTLPALMPSLSKDLKDRSFIFYNNCVLIVSKKSIAPIEYKAFPGFIWRSQILDRDFKYEGDQFYLDRSEFEKFVDHVCGGDLKKKQSLESIIAYAIHTYKDPSIPKAVILCDEISTTNQNLLAQGGTGKGIIVSAIGYFRKITKEDGKLFNPKNDFLFQQLDFDTDILFLDDVQKGFYFEKLFSVASEGIQIERKFETKFSIPYSNSPKILITSNYPIDGLGDSHQRRRIELALTRHYNANYTPKQEFGHLLFYEWTKEEWAKFDLYIIKCLMEYLNTGLIEFDPEYHQEMKLIQKTSPAFVEFWKDNILKGKEYDATSLFKEYINSYDEENSLTKHMFSKYLKFLAISSGLEYVERYSNGDKFIIFK